MHGFNENLNPLAERMSDEELRSVLHRLGDLEFGGDERPTVGAVVEATGADAATILRVLYEIRSEALRNQQVAYEAIERRVSGLEERLVPRVSPVAPVYRETKDKPDRLAAFVLVIVLAVAIWFFSASVTTFNRPGGLPKGFSMSTGDGWTKIDGDGQLRVHQPDGSTRTPTAEEEFAIRALAEGKTP